MFLPADGPPADTDPQCPLLIQRIEEIEVDLSAESDPARARHHRHQLRTLTERARRLGCFANAPARRAVISAAD